MKDLRIPMLKQNPSMNEVMDYLKWLDESPYAYHLDDCPTEIIWDVETSEEYVNLLKWNHDVMWSSCMADFLWDFYGEDISEDENF